MDSCLGGKTGINYKNLINSIEIIIHKMYLFLKNVIELIPDREYLSGIPEIIKCGIIIDNIKNFQFLKKIKTNWQIGIIILCQTN